MKNQTLKNAMLMGFCALSMTGCGQDDLNMKDLALSLEPSVRAAVSSEFKKQNKKGKDTFDYSKSFDAIKYKSIEFPRFAAIVAYHLDKENGANLSEDTIMMLTDKMKDLESDLYLKTFYSSLKSATDYTKEVVSLNTKNRYGYRIRNTFDMVVPVDSYFSDNFPTQGQIVLSDELVPYPDCKEHYQPILLHTPLYPIGESVVEPFDITATNEKKGWRIAFEGYRAMVDLACVPEKESDDGIEAILGD